MQKLIQLYTQKPTHRLDHLQEAKVLHDLRGKQDCEELMFMIQRIETHCWLLVFLPQEVVQLHGVAESKTKLFLVLELCEGGTLPWDNATQ
jgi:hypothetical protein